VISRDAATGDYWLKDLNDDRRERVKADRLFAWTPEIDAKIAEYEALRDEANALLRKANAVLKTIRKPSDDEVALLLLDLAKAPEEE
jgi:hypothetical protein